MIPYVSLLDRSPGAHIPTLHRVFFSRRRFGDPPCRYFSYPTTRSSDGCHDTPSLSNAVHIQLDRSHSGQSEGHIARSNPKLAHPAHQRASTARVPRQKRPATPSSPGRLRRTLDERISPSHVDAVVPSYPSRSSGSNRLADSKIRAGHPRCRRIDGRHGPPPRRPRLAFAPGTAR